VQRPDFGLNAQSRVTLVWDLSPLFNAWSSPSDTGMAATYPPAVPSSKRSAGLCQQERLELPILALRGALRSVVRRYGTRLGTLLLVLLSRNPLFGTRQVPVNDHPTCM
jgi:hypothetical protein